MRPRFRFVAALLALLALTTSVVEQAWAGACLGADGSTAVAAAAPDAHAAHAPSGHESHVPRDHRGAGSTDPAGCPMAAASGMVCGVVALPVAATSAPLGVEVQVAVLPAADEAAGSLAISSLFRPPRR